ncbi:MBL fold metallo-hydrolase [Nocardia sp. NPDC059246]|uniref:MBL fold metallo-hydrolase n=1 Tax=unclassified Nocardia TaxID=2637762 RepID=UPI0036911045
MLKVIPLDAATVHPRGGHLWDGVSPIFGPAEMVCTCLAIIHERGIALIDTGPGSAAVDDGGKSMGRLWTKVFRPDLTPDNSLVAQLRRRGIEPADVTDVLLTHGDPDHAGGLHDFPHAIIHVHRDELTAIAHPSTIGERNRYRPSLFTHDPLWCVYGHDSADVVDWFGFRAHPARGLPAVVLLVELAGHLRGMLGVAVDIGGHWLLHAADAYFHASEIDPRRPRPPIAVRAFGFATKTLASAYPEQQTRLRNLVRDHGNEVTVISSHCAAELRRLQNGPGPAAQPGPR